MNSTSYTQPEFNYSKLAIKTRRSGVFIVNFEHISHFVLVFLLLTLNIYFPVSYIKPNNFLVN